MTETASSGLRRKPHILFVGEGNANRTQMAEAYLRDMAGDMVDAQSAGMRSRPVDKRAIEVMSEEGIDIIKNVSKLASADLLTWADIIVTISGREERVSPAIPHGAREKQWPIDPPESRMGGDELQAYRDTREDVKRRVQQLINAMRLFKG